MATNPIISEIRDLIAKSETERALVKLTTHLEQSAGPERAWLNTLLQLRSRWERAQKEALLAVGDPSLIQRTFNEVTLRLLEVLTAIEGGKLPLADERPAGRLKMGLISGVLAAVIVVGGLVWYFMSRTDEPSLPEEPITTDCPVFADGSMFNVLILPFKNLRGEALNVHSIIKDRLSIESEKYRLPASVKIRAVDLDESSYPSTGSEAAVFGEDCKAQLVIWGTTEAKSSGDIVLTRFRFLNLGERFSLTKLQFSEAMEVDTLSSLSSIATEGLLTEDIEYNIKLLFGVMAHESGQDSLAVALLEAADIKDSSASLMRGMLLADSYLALDDHEKAVRSYDQVIQEHPNYSLARNNRAMLLYQQRQYEAAALDLTTVVENNPTDATARAQRASAYLKANRLDKAEEDIQHISTQEASKRSTVTRQLQQELNTKQEVLQSQQQQNEQILRADPTNVQALESKAQLSRNLGDYNAAIRSTEQILKQDPDNAKATAILIEAYREIKDTAAATRVLQKAQQLKVPADALLRAAPSLRTVVKKGN